MVKANFHQMLYYGHVKLISTFDLTVANVTESNGFKSEYTVANFVILSDVLAIRLLFMKVLKLNAQDMYNELRSNFVAFNMI